MKTEQEKFWSGKFGDSYIERNIDSSLLSSNLSLFSGIFNSTQDVNSVLELGCNVGMNLKAIEKLMKQIKLGGVDINKKALDILKKERPDFDLKLQSVIEPISFDKADLTFTKGVLIHINPSYLDEVYKNLYNLTSKYICVIEYYDPQPTTISYRGHEERLFKRDFCGEMLTKFKDLCLVDYGFKYHRDPTFPQDDLTWFLMKK